MPNDNDNMDSMNQESDISKGRGFNNMDPKKRRDAGSKGGKAAHQKGTANEFDSETGKEAGRKGGSAPRGEEDEL
jgi:general stress protein YciG